MCLARLWRLALPMFVLAISLRVIDKLGLFAVQALGRRPLTPVVRRRAELRDRAGAVRGELLAAAAG